MTNFELHSLMFNKTLQQNCFWWCVRSSSFRAHLVVYDQAIRQHFVVKAISLLSVCLCPF